MAERANFGFGLMMFTTAGLAPILFAALFNLKRKPPKQPNLPKVVDGAGLEATAIIAIAYNRERCIFSLACMNVTNVPVHIIAVQTAVRANQSPSFDGYLDWGELTAVCQEYEPGSEVSVCVANFPSTQGRCLQNFTLAKYSIAVACRIYYHEVGSSEALECRFCRVLDRESVNILDAEAQITTLAQTRWLVPDDPNLNTKTNLAPIGGRIAVEEPESSFVHCTDIGVSMFQDEAGSQSVTYLATFTLECLGEPTLLNSWQVMMKTAKTDLVECTLLSSVPAIAPVPESLTVGRVEFSTAFQQQPLTSEPVRGFLVFRRSEETFDEILSGVHFAITFSSDSGRRYAYANSITFKPADPKS